MNEFYPWLKDVHVAIVVASGSLFLLRGLAVQLGIQSAMAPVLRYLSYGIDTVLLAAGVALVAIVPVGWFGNGWLWAKLGLLPVYIVLGSYALKRGQTRRTRAICYVAAVTVFLAIAAIARTHHPLGPWLALRGWLT